MKLKHYLLILCNAVIGLLNAQSLDWYDNIGSRDSFFRSNNITITQMESDSQFVYILGGFDYLPIQFRQNQRTILAENRYKEAFIAQYTHDGLLKWVKTLGSYTYTTQYRRHRMALHQKHLYLTGVLRGKSWLDNDSILNTQSIVYLAKFDIQGNKIWHKLASPTYWSDDNEPKGLWVDKQEQIYIAGEQRGFRPLIFDSVSTQIGSKQFVFKFDTAGKPLQAISAKITQPSTNWGFNIVDATIDTYNNFWLLMSDGSRNTSSSCAYTSWRTSLYRITPQGQMDSITAIDCSDLMTGTALSIAENGDMYIAGQYRGQLEIGGFKSEDKGCALPTAFLARVTQKGKLVWFRTGNAGEFSDIYQLKTEKDGNLLVMGIQHYELGQSKDKFRYPNYPRLYPNGEKRIYLKRMSPFGATIDSVQFYTNDFRAESAQHMNLRFTQSPQGQFFCALEYRCKLDSFSHSLCEEGIRNPMDGMVENDGLKLLIARLSNKMLQKKQVLPILGNYAFHVFPNPTSSFIFLQADAPLQEPIQINIYDINGRLVQTVTYDEKNSFIELNLETQPAGIYLLTVRQQDNFLFSTKIVKL